ncbi:preprotein translocase subunit SecE [Neisseria sp. Ec49-e6-T10]|uniref:preprotein translocase subunit SecE n=1 Tax=Neisseria sp. Ec49-e6-T10 TaxID=3140744 RepID=UPI003EBEFF8F
MSNKPTNELTTEKKPLSKKEEHKQKEMQEQKRKSLVEKVKLILSVLVLALSFVVYYEFVTLPTYVRVAVPVVGVIVALIMIFFWCDLGKRLTRYVRDATIELKKVVWPPRNEATKQTLFVIAFVFILAGFTWLCDSGLSWLIYTVILGG